jgi:HlyD family secretion protein
VPQAIFLADSSIRENIAFGLPPETIDEDRVRRAATMAHLDELLDELPLGLETRVGERGVQLSGGQRQRIGIARALYDDADVLILDEATSALDGITERLIMDAIHDFAGRKTIIMIAHRLATVQQCDCIYLLANGQVVDQGSYDELHQRNAVFQRMAQHA